MLSYSWNVLKSTAFADGLIAGTCVFQRRPFEGDCPTGSSRSLQLHKLSKVLKAFKVWCFKSARRHIKDHASGSKPPFLRTFAKVVSSDEPRTKREELYREAPPSLPSVVLPLMQCDFMTISGNGAACLRRTARACAPRCPDIDPTRIF